MSAQQAMNNLTGTITAGAVALSHISAQNKMAKDIKAVASSKGGVDSYAAKIASDSWRQKAQAIQEQKERYTKRMAGGIFNDDSRQKAIKAREELEKRKGTTLNMDIKKPDDKGGK